MAEGIKIDIAEDGEKMTIKAEFAHWCSIEFPKTKLRIEGYNGIADNMVQQLSYDIREMVMQAVTEALMKREEKN